MILIRDEAYLQVYLTIGTPFLFMKKEIALVFDIALTTPPSQGRIFDMYIREIAPPPPPPPPLITLAGR